MANQLRRKGEVALYQKLVLPWEEKLHLKSFIGLGRELPMVLFGECDSVGAIPGSCSDKTH